MRKVQQMKAVVEEVGRLVLPQEFSQNMGLLPGTEVIIERDANSARLLRPVTNLARIYVEATSRCNLECATCMRNVWDEPQGMMQKEVYDLILDGVIKNRSIPTIFFGGYGEPLLHPNIVDMIRDAVAIGCRVELITNGILLDEEMALDLMKAGLDMLWVSIDGASPESYADVRLGASLPKVIGNLQRLRPLRYRLPRHTTSMQLGISFVAMKRNIADLPEIVKLGASLGAVRISVTNVLAHTPMLNTETLYRESLHDGGYLQSGQRPLVVLPSMDFIPATADILEALRHENCTLTVTDADPAHAVDVCPFVARGSLSVRWDGAVSPCLPLLHTHESYLYDRVRRSHASLVGSLKERSLQELWLDEDYVSLRKRLQQFDFSPCTYCNCCNLAEENCEDCLRNPQPTCGGCLWAQGIIQCP